MLPGIVVVSSCLFVFVGGHVTQPLYAPASTLFNAWPGSAATTYSNGQPVSAAVVHTPHYWYTTYTCPVCPAPPPPKPEPDPEYKDVIEYTKKIGETVCNVGSTLSEIGEIALEDDAEVGAEIIKMLQTEVSQGSKVFAQFAEDSSSSKKPGGRRKRAAKQEGSEALDKVGEVLSKANTVIDAQMKKLSKKARDKISQKHKDGLEKCRADSCKAASKLLAAGSDEDERQ